MFVVDKAGEKSNVLDSYMRVGGAFGEGWGPFGAQKVIVWDLGAISLFGTSPFWLIFL